MPDGMIEIRAKQLEVFGGGRCIDFGVFQPGDRRNLRVVRNLEGALGNGPVFIERACAILLDLRQVFVINGKLLVLDGFLVIGIGASDI